MTTDRMNTVQSGSLLSLPTLLGIVFIVLKLTGVIDWSWIWVLAPFWISAGLSILLMIVFLAVFVWADSRRA